MKTNIISFILLILALTACTSAQPVDVQSTAIVLAKTGVALTQTAQPTATLPPTVTPTATVTYPAPSPYPPLPPIFDVTPNAIQINNWKSYQTALAKSILPYTLPELLHLVLCEWSILGQSDQEIYVWAVCDSGERGSSPAVIYINADGSIQNVKAVNPDSTRGSQIRQLFPPNIQEKIFSNFISTVDEQLIIHLDWRRTHPEEPPLIVFSATPTP